jgi:N4-gp56 family major capsid protein
VRFIETSEAKVFEESGVADINVYATLVVGKDAYGTIPLEGQNLDFIFKALGESGTADPLDQRWTSGWKVAFAAKILNDLAMVRIEHAATNG